jgi:hypothetical protein
MSRFLLVVVLLQLFAAPLAWGAPPSTLVVFVHGRYQDASGPDWTDDNPADDARVVSFIAPGPFGNVTFRGVPVKGTMEKRVREDYWMTEKTPGLAQGVESTVGRPRVYYARYDARDSFYYEAKAAPLVAREVRAWLAADPGRRTAVRNIVWIAHSNGGIVVRRLMSDRSAYGDLIGRTREAITLGTPNLGSQMADASIDGDRINALSQALIDADGTVAGPARFFGQKFSIFDLASQVLKPQLEKVKAEARLEAEKQGASKSEKRKEERAAQARVMATALDKTLSGRIDQQLTTTYMADDQSDNQAPNRALLPTDRLPVPFYWVRGNAYPMDLGAVVGRMFGKNGWSPEDVQYFICSVAIMNPRLAKEYPKDKASRRSDGVVSVDSAAAVGSPLGGDARKSSFPDNHGGLLFDPKITALIQEHLSALPTGPKD